MNISTPSSCELPRLLSTLGGAVHPPFFGAEVVAAAAIPAPYRELLVHERSMTATLEAFAGRALSLEVHRAHRDDRQMVRQIELVDERGLPYEFATIRIDLSCFTGRARVEIEECRLALGRILHEHRLAYRVRPAAFLRVRPDPFGRQIPWSGVAGPLYGRHNTLWTPEGRLMAQIIEVLPPFGARGMATMRAR